MPMNTSMIPVRKKRRLRIPKRIFMASLPLDVNFFNYYIELNIMARTCHSPRVNPGNPLYDTKKPGEPGLFVRVCEH